MIFATGAVFAVVGLISAQRSPIGWAIVLAGAIVVIGSLFTTPQTITAWAIGAVGEARTASYLEQLIDEGFRVIHDRAIPGSRANIDHIVIGPPGIVVVETKSFKGRLRVRGLEVYVDGRRRTGMIEEVRREALAVQIALADEIEAHGYRIGAIICVHRADLPWRRVQVDGIPIVAGRGLVKILRGAPGQLSQAEVEHLAGLVAARLRPAAPEPAVSSATDTSDA